MFTFDLVLFITNHWVVGTSVLNHISDEMFLTIICRQDGDLFSRVSDKSHVHESCDDVFSFSQILVEIRRGLRFTNTIEIANIDELNIYERNLNLFTVPDNPKRDQRLLS